MSEQVDQETESVDVETPDDTTIYYDDVLRDQQLILGFLTSTVGFPNLLIEDYGCPALSLVRTLHRIEDQADLIAAVAHTLIDELNGR